MASAVPTDVGALLEQHGQFLPYVITKIIRHHLNEDELEDLQQEILLTLHARKYLDKCRAYEATCVAEGRPYSFLASLRTFVERLTKNYLRYRHAAMRDPVLTTPLPDQQEQTPIGLADRRVRPIPQTLRVEAHQDVAALASARLSRIRTKLASGRRVIGGVAAVDVFDVATADDGAGYDTLDKYARRQLRKAVEETHVAA